MNNIIQNIIKNGTELSDEIIACNMLTAAEGACGAYLAATLASSTPELRTMFASSLTAAIASHSALMELCINRGWLKLYDTPLQQLEQEYDKAKIFVE